MLIELIGRPDLGDLAPGAGDRLAHIDQLGKDVAGDAMPRRGLGHRPLDPFQRLEQQLGLGGAVAARIFGEEPTPARACPQDGFERGIGVGEAWPGLSLGLRGAGAVWGAFRHRWKG